MNDDRERILEAVRRAVTAGNRAGDTAPLGPRGTIGYQGAGADPVARFRDELSAAGGHFHPAVDAKAATALVLGLLRERGVRRVLLGWGPVLNTLDLAEATRAAGLEPIRIEEATREATFAADAGVSGVDYLIAETGTIVLESRSDQPRSVSLLPPLHIAVAGRHQLVPDLFDLFEGPVASERVPACVSLITGPSKTGDIELRLVTGVHGPGEVHVVLVG
jgi:L-lactate utilization protein LutC